MNRPASATAAKPSSGGVTLMRGGTVGAAMQNAPKARKALSGALGTKR